MLSISSFFLFRQHDSPMKKSNATTYNDERRKEISSGVKIVFLGDSLTEGYGLDSTNSYPLLVERKLRDSGRKNITVINAGQSGSTSASSLSRLRWILKSKERPTHLILALGANDGLRGLDVNKMKNNLEATIDLALQHNLKVLFCGMMVPPNYTKKYADDFYKVFQEISHRKEIVYMPFLLEGVAGERQYNLPDGIHPNEKGHEIIANNIYPYIEKMIP